MQTPVTGVTHLYHFAGNQGAPDPQSLPADTRYVAKLRDQWERFWIQERPGHTVPTAISSNLPSAGVGRAMAAALTVTGIGPYYLKTSSYDLASAFIQIQIGNLDREATLEAVRNHLSEEVQLIERRGTNFDMLAYVGGANDQEVDQKIADLPAQVPGITILPTLHVADYVSRSAHAPNDDHHFPPGHRFS